MGYPEGIYRVGPLARLNVADRCGTPKADAELAEFRQRFGKPAHSSFLFHYARLIELLYALERIEPAAEQTRKSWTPMFAPPPASTRWKAWASWKPRAAC